MLLVAMPSDVISPTVEKQSISLPIYYENGQKIKD